MVEMNAGAPAEPWSDDLDCMPPGKRPRTLSDTPLTFSAPSDPPENPLDVAARGFSQDTLQERPALPRGIKLKFDPSDEELLGHLLAKFGKGEATPHPLISEFIFSLDDDDDQFGYTHPQGLVDVKQVGSASYFFHKRFKIFNPLIWKHQKMQSADFGVFWWQKIGETIPVTSDGIHRGCKKILVLYATVKESGIPEKTDWVMHQYHLGRGEDGEGEFVASKIFYQQKSTQSERKAHDLISMEASLQEAVNHKRGEVTQTNVEPEEVDMCDSRSKENSPDGDTELIDLQQHVEGTIANKDLCYTQSSCATEDGGIPCMSDNPLSAVEPLNEYPRECQNGGDSICYSDANPMVDSYEFNGDEAKTSTQFDNAVSTVDYTSVFTRDEIFKSREEMIKWTRDRGRMFGFSIVIKKSRMSGPIRNPLVFFSCERGGKYRSHRKKSITGENRGKMPKRSSFGVTKKCDCPFSLTGRKLDTYDDDWMLVVDCGVHNHPESEKIKHSLAGRLSEEEYALVVELFNKLISPRDILATLKQRDPLNAATVKTIYNALQKHKKALKAVGVSQVQQESNECVSYPESSDSLSNMTDESNAIWSFSL